jgi:hypothetical protein
MLCSHLKTSAVSFQQNSKKSFFSLSFVFMTSAPTVLSFFPEICSTICADYISVGYYDNSKLIFASCYYRSLSGKSAGSQREVSGKSAGSQREVSGKSAGSQREVSGNG